jgi:hypothetical protein
MARLGCVGVTLVLLLATAPGTVVGAQQDMSGSEKKKIRNVLEDYFKVADPTLRDEALLKKADEVARDLDRRRGSKKKSVLTDLDGLREVIRDSQSFPTQRGRGLRLIEWKESPFPGPGDKVRFQLSLPRRYRPNTPTPVILALHPKGMDAASFVSRKLLKNRDMADRYLIVAPEWMDRKNDPWGTETEVGRGALLIPLAYLLRGYNVDPDRIYILGEAEGGTAALDVAMSFTDLFAGVFAFGGGAVRPLEPNLDHVAVHEMEPGDGPYDAVVSKIEGEGENPTLLTRDLFRKKIDWRFHSKNQQRAFWILVEGERKRPEGETGRITAEVKDGNVIEITTVGVESFKLFLNDRLVSLDEPVTVVINGVKQEPWKAERSLVTALWWMAEMGDFGRLFVTEKDFIVPAENGDKKDGDE